MVDEVKARPTYEDLLAENIRLRQRVIELEGTAAPQPPSSEPTKKFKPHELDPNADDAFRRPAYSRRTE